MHLTREALLGWIGNIPSYERSIVTDNGGTVVSFVNTNVLVNDDDGNPLAYIPCATVKEATDLADEVVSALKRNRIAARLKSTQLVECGACGHFHPVDFRGDCRDDGNRFFTPNDSDDIAYEEEEDE